MTGVPQTSYFRLLHIINRARKIQTQSRRVPNDPKQIVQMIKQGELTKLQQFFERDDNSLLLEMLN
jgi:hypothetical protein